jgi:hypothetical protein
MCCAWWGWTRTCSCAIMSYATSKTTDANDIDDDDEGGGGGDDDDEDDNIKDDID